MDQPVDGAGVIPGVDSPTEAIETLSAGADAVKLFPAGRWTLESFRGVRAPFPQIPFVPTGGITAAAAPLWIAAGPVAVGMGSSLTDGPLHEATARVEELTTALNR
ncbi:hypothetical protein AB0C40_03640 [Streptomyces brevispora]|uniref:hypothetical protein n=1 Tax=Streptomyces brevispora TaxID=887462 RepID=UPI00340CAEBA